MPNNADCPTHAPVHGGGLTFWTDDPFLIAAVRRAGELERRVVELEAENERLRHDEIGRYRTLRRDVHQIKRLAQKAAR